MLARKNGKMPGYVAMAKILLDKDKRIHLCLNETNAMGADKQRIFWQRVMDASQSREHFI